MSQLKPLTWNEYISSDASVYRFSESQCVGGAVHLSNFYVRKSGLFVIDGLTWSSVIQYYYASRFAYDGALFDKIREMHDPNKIIQDFKHMSPRSKTIKWERIATSILKRGMYAKIEQNIELFLELNRLTNSAISSIKDEPFEHRTFAFLLKIKSFYQRKGHPLDQFKRGALKPYIAKLYNSYCE